MGILRFSWRALKYLKRELSGKSVEKIKPVNPSLKMGNSLLVENFYLNVRTLLPGKIFLQVGDDCIIDGTFTFETPKGNVVIGNRVFLGKGNVICINHIEIEDDVFISWGVYIFDNDSHSLDYRHRLHDMQNHLTDWKKGLADYNTSKDWSHVNSAPIKICRYAWIGMECKILKGVTIGEGAIVGAGSVVTKNVEPWTIVAGNPAKFVKAIPEELRKK